jgi:Fe-S-cluster containining protein
VTEAEQLRAAWLAAARDDRVAAELEAVYALIADQIEARGPRCDVSGRCCHFEQHGHRLYVTGLEAAYTVARLGLVRGRDHDGVIAAHGELRADEVSAARARGDCPFLVEEKCSVHAIRPLGCRVYYCDPTAQEWQEELSERTLKLVRGMHERHQVPYRYGEWRGMLGVLVGG